MTQKEVLEAVTEEELLALADKYTSATDIVINHFGFSRRYPKIISDKLEEFDIEFLNTKKDIVSKYIEITKKCPVCGLDFVTKLHSPKEKTVCSRACANTYFRSGKNNPNFITGKHSYRSICYRYHKRKCIICEETLVLDVHHIDKDHTNIDPDNLIPLCPTHHRYMHSKHKHIIKDRIQKYIENFKQCRIADGFSP